MKTILNELKNELNNFWMWANQTPHEYAKNGWMLKQEEWEYPNWDMLIKLTIEAIKAVCNGEKTKELIDCILEVMALDNEDEQILDECEEKLTFNDLLYLVQIAILHIQREARWQIAELLGRYKNNDTTEFLRRLIGDDDKYVQRRALLSLTKVNICQAEEICLTKLTDEDDYLRLVSLRILREIKSDFLEQAISTLKNDKFQYIQKEIEEIKMGLT